MLTAPKDNEIRLRGKVPKLAWPLRRKTSTECLIENLVQGPSYTAHLVLVRKTLQEESNPVRWSSNGPNSLISKTNPDGPHFHCRQDLT